mmetsp:Transcript_23217/g.38175  ORF Transcript_23217/g.38175 Transcript_23217/m.38175 type:complete len:329 (+) Transcript_23217:105-1091(+)
MPELQFISTAGAICFVSKLAYSSIESALEHGNAHRNYTRKVEIVSRSFGLRPVGCTFHYSKRLPVRSRSFHYSICSTDSSFPSAEQAKQPSASPSTLPLFELFQCVLLPIPTESLDWNIFEPKYKTMFTEIIDNLPHGQRFFGVVYHDEDSAVPVLHGVCCEIMTYRMGPEGRIIVSSAVRNRFRTLNYVHEKPFRRAAVEWMEDTNVAEEEVVAAEAEIRRTLDQLFGLSKRLYGESTATTRPLFQQLYELWCGADTAAQRKYFAFVVAQSLELPAVEQQKYLQSTSPAERLLLANETLQYHLKMLAAKVAIEDLVKPSQNSSMGPD